ncbi:uncharacterized protein LOC112500209 [Cynara cardunculus var. scolymus]|uniref:Uncharacterized protein n=1 Tax=Cynara cardunculus var. scolymus TaxID=59895 RepID=A0A124SF13_CYNCS|nr:uncharacterized protein LOC112500209 [Cynara cardunculus var. scolymus]KVI01817.1 hypothetical protein Ccrd_019890 [Cynara cardunculus var. scolymus]
MDVAVIDWKDSKFEKDNLYEDINAPQWIDFSDDDPPVDDEAWFCRPDCNHPKTVEDFFRQRTPDSSKLQRSASVSEIPKLGDRFWRDAALKKRGFPSNTDSKSTKSVQDSENQNPNFSTPPNHKAKSIKEMIKSSSEKNHVEDGFLVKEEPPRVLKSSLSARNLFAGRDILNQVTEFCNEMKRLATRAKDNGEKEIAKKDVVATKKQEMGVLQESKNERMPLLEVKKEKYAEMEKYSNVKEKKLTRKNTSGESENEPISLNVKSIRGKDEERVLQIRTNPPSPQCFSANNGPIKATPPRPFRLRPQERGMLQEREKSSIKEVKKGNTNQAAPVSTTQNEAKGLDVFWIFKPCTLSS